MTGMDLIRSQRGLMAKLARELDLSRAAVTRWQDVPADRLSDISRITGIKAATLRPDLAKALGVHA